MENDELLDTLITELWNINRLDIMSYIREFTEGETATLWELYKHGESNPSLICESVDLSRARMAKVLLSLRKKKFVSMDISENDRRCMTVKLTDEGKSYLERKYAFIQEYIARYIEKLGTENTEKLLILIQKLISCGKTLEEE